jgi:glycosyltransferase involved in cell wall biosynthesis
MKVAFVCDWLTGMRGGEKCLEAACELYPDADIFTLVHFPGAVSAKIESHKIVTSYIENLPGDIKKFRRYLLLFPHAIQKLDFSGYDCILSFSHCVAKGVKVPKGVPHICYCHTPMRYAWHMRDEYLNNFGFLKKYIVNLMLDYLKNWDEKATIRVTHFIASSRNVQNRIKQAYNRESVVIYPPVECNRFVLSDVDDGYYLIVSALVPYKRIDIAVETFSTIGRKLVVIGNGPELSHLKSTASSNVSFIEDADDDEVVKYMQKCRALIFPGEEDFGIVPLEAQACGKPVIAFGNGGALETVRGISQNTLTELGHTGLFFYEQTPCALREAILSFENVLDKFDPETCRYNALRFDRSIFMRTLSAYIKRILGSRE